MDNLGYSFSPQTPMGDQAKGTGAPQVQQAIKTLSTSVPRVVGANSPIPQGLLNGPGSGAMAGGPEGLEAILRRLFGLGPAPTGPMPQSGAVPSPSFIPGANPNPSSTPNPTAGDQSLPGGPGIPGGATSEGGIGGPSGFMAGPIGPPTKAGPRFLGPPIGNGQTPPWNPQPPVPVPTPPMDPTPTWEKPSLSRSRW